MIYFTNSKENFFQWHSCFLLVIMTTSPILKRQMGGFRSHITCIYKRYKARPDTEVTVSLLEEYMSDTRDKLNRIEELDSSILGKLEDPEVVDQEIESSVVAKCEIREIIAELSARKRTLETVPSVSVPVRSPASDSVKLPLPPILLDPFEGNRENPLGFFNFKKSFENASAGMPNLTKAQKLIYL